MARKAYTTRFPVRKLNRKPVFKKKQVNHSAREAGHGQKGISRRSK